MSGLALAGRYAKALFELAAKDSSSDKVEADLLQLMNTVNDSPNLKAALKNPSLSKKSMSKLMSDLLKKLGASSLATTFIMVVVQNGRIKYLSEIVSAYSTLMMKGRGEELAYVTTATPLKTAQIQEVEKAIGTALGSRIKAVVSVNDEVLGGIIVRIGSKMLDASISGQLGKLSVINRKAIANLN